jgi:hypothetical protein
VREYFLIGRELDLVLYALEILANDKASAHFGEAKKLLAKIKEEIE